MLIDWLHPYRLGSPPDSDLCGRLLAIVGGDTTEHLQQIADWLRELHGAKDPRSVQGWGWFVALLQSHVNGEAASA
jgi:hypothetical protein